jgi:predicted dehydrogenase
MKLGLLGLKGHQSVVLAGARELGDVEVVGIAEADAAAAERLKKREAVAKNATVFADWRRLLDHTAMDVCCVCDENGLRAEQLVALAKAGVHVVTEKPLTTTLADLGKVRDAWAKAKGRLTMLLTMRHEPKYHVARRLIKEGVVGEVCQVTSQKSYRLDTRADWFKSRERLGGIIPFIGIHPIDLMRWTTGLDYTHAAAFQGAQGHRDQLGETESHASVLLKMSNGATATARLDYLRPQPAPTHGDDRLRVAGTEGVIEMREDNPKLMLVTGKRKPYEVEAEKTTNLFTAFVRAVRAGAPTPIPMEDCFTVTEVVLRARDAAEAGKLVELLRPAG